MLHAFSLQIDGPIIPIKRRDRFLSAIRISICLKLCERRRLHRRTGLQTGLEMLAHGHVLRHQHRRRNQQQLPRLRLHRLWQTEFMLDLHEHQVHLPQVHVLDVCLLVVGYDKLIQVDTMN